MHTHPSHQSELHRNLRKNALCALREYRNLKTTYEFARGIQWGLYLGFKHAAERCAFLSNEAPAVEVPEADYGHPVFLDQGKPFQSPIDLNSEARIHEDSRVNYHDA